MPRLFLLLVLSILFFCRASSAHNVKSPHRPANDGAAVIREMNVARQSPTVYAGYLEKLRGHFHGNILALPGHSMFRTREGVGAVNEAIQFLQHTRPLLRFVASPGISLAAAEHVADQASGGFGHSGSDHANPGERMNRHGAWNTLWGENISYGKSSARDIVIALIVDDGLRGRKHRKNIFNPIFTCAGAAVGPHARYQTVCTIDFAGSYSEGTSPNDRLIARN